MAEAAILPFDRPTRLRVAILLPNLLFGGAERVSLTLASALTAIGCDVTILLMKKTGELLGEAEDKWPVVDLYCHRTKYLPSRLIEYFHNSETDILISSFWKLNLCASLVRLRHRHLRVLLWEHGHVSASPNSPNILYALSASIIYRFARKVICVSTGVARDVLSLTLGLRSRVIVINNPIPAPVRAISVESRGRHRIAWVGRFTPQKNPRLMIEAFSLISSEVEAELVFIGDGSMRSELETMVGQEGLQGRVNFLGFQDDPGKMLGDCDLLVLTSDWEGFGNVLVEALAAGLTVISTDSGGGVDDIINEPQYGSIVPRGNAHALARKIVFELSNLRDRNEQKQGAVRFLPELIARQFLIAAGFERRIPDLSTSD